ncbi:hypothetical protein AURDEDRAFT_176350 [Auricularia subglabra TFB-10046 SS5]|uniref:S-adenosyl-L-methionine dependent methyltransferase n=1 Tax=Auricularia subglabra (strain TFB-10046 / SS5) TaxID=717982 RepID=J0WQ65_AURST|nr:hypothetical protein AURDEDRAFT_176350 [Auricularia subglabra TFB-10046 SS5]
MSVPVDYAALAEQYEPLKPFVVATARGAAIDFSNQQAVRVLNQALYWTTLRIRLVLPHNRLCPPLENRRAYIAWLQELAVYTYPVPRGFTDADNVVVDIGTGASAVYPLIGCSTWPQVRFLATERDEVSAHWAQTNIDTNNLGDRVKLVPTRLGDPILRPFFDSPAQRAMFTMCNPPFYSSAEEMRELAAKKEAPATTVYTGGENESITPGGEVAFVTAMMRESTEHVRDRCIWYTSMVGKASSVEHLADFLRANNVDNYAVSRFVAGNTRRWLIAWSFSGIRLPDVRVSPHHQSRSPHSSPQDVARKSGIPGFAGHPLSNAIERPFPHRTDLPALLDAILRAIPGLGLSYLAPLPAQYPFAVRVTATSVTWTRKARRAGAPPAAGARPVLVCVVLLKTEEGAGTTRLACRWEYGFDRGHFESLAGHVGSKLAAHV